MDLDIINTAGSALSSERLRMDVIASNIANVHTTHNANGEYSPYRRKMVNFKTMLDKQQASVKGVSVKSIEEDDGELKAVYEPGNPDADKHGYVYYPNISIEREMVDMLSAKTSYQANVKAIQVFKSMYNSALEL